MGYTSKFSLKILDDRRAQDDEYLSAIRDEMRNMPEPPLALDLENDGPREYRCWGETKWYDHREDLQRLSRKFRGTIFVLTRIGEENGHRERIYALDGIVEKVPAAVVWPDAPAFIRARRDFTNWLLENDK